MGRRLVLSSQTVWPYQANESLSQKSTLTAVYKEANTSAPSGYFQTQTILVKISGQKTKKRHKCSIRKGEDDGGRERKESESKSKRKICEQNC